METPVRIAIAGLGRLGKRHAEIFRWRTRGAELVADLYLAGERRARRGETDGGSGYLRVPVISADVALLLGGLVAVPGGECAPEASSGFDACGVCGV